MAPWLEKAPTPATDILAEIVEAAREICPEETLNFFVSNKFFRQHEIEGKEVPPGGHPMSIQALPGYPQDSITLEIPRNKKKKFFCIYKLADFTHIKGLDLLLERAPSPTR